MISEVHPLIQYLSFLCIEQSKYNINTRYFGNEMNILQNLNPFNSNSLQYNINPYVIQLNQKYNGNNHLLLQKNQYFDIKTKKTKKLKKNLVRFESPNQEKIQKPRSHIKEENIIKISALISGEEKRTFVMLYPIPKSLSVFDMVKIIDKYLKIQPGKRIYNAIYLPLSKKMRKNIGYCFVNLISPKYVVEFYNKFNGFYFRFKNFRKSCSVVFSDNQNIDLSNDDPSRKPIIFKDTIKETD
jgi:hypothetical protein